MRRRIPEVAGALMGAAALIFIPAEGTSRQAAGLRCETFDGLALGSPITVQMLNPVPANTWQPPNGDFWGAKFVASNGRSITTGSARIEDKKRAGGLGREARINNISLCFSANTGQVLNRIQFSFGEYGGNLNLSINGTLVNFKDFRDIHGQVIAGVKVKVLNGGNGNDAGAVELTGVIKEQMGLGHLAIGGQELWIDDFCWE